MDKEKLEGLQWWQQETCYVVLAMEYFAVWPLAKITVFQAKVPLRGKEEMKEYKGTKFLSRERNLFFK